MNQYKGIWLMCLFVFSALLATMTVSGQRLPGDSVIWIKRTDALRKLAQADSLPGYKQMVDEKQKDIDILQDRITELQGIITNLKEKDSVSVQLFRDQLEVMKQQKTLFQDQLNGYERLLRREKRKRFWSSAAGIAATGIATYLFISK